jgi:hypothetical protein
MNVWNSHNAELCKTARGRIAPRRFLRQAQDRLFASNFVVTGQKYDNSFDRAAFSKAHTLHPGLGGQFLQLPSGLRPFARLRSATGRVYSKASEFLANIATSDDDRTGAGQRAA